jgi:hypothetical protein
MSKFDNPTALQIGATGKLCDRNYRVIGRVVLGMSEAGETYYWNEYNLLDDRGHNATLVFEETEDGPEWKLFIMFDPLSPMTAAEAASKKVGDTAALNGKPIKITLVSQSRVYHIEGRAPEGVEIGDVANYFNADAGAEMEVASWTGNDIEFYRGLDVSIADVAAAFKLSEEKLTGAELEIAPTGAAIATPSRGYTKLIPVVIGGIILFVLLAGIFSPKKTKTPASPPKPKTPPARLAANASGTLNGQHRSVTGHTVAEIARVGARYNCHEYTLSDGALLINGLTGDPSQWHLLNPARPVEPLTPVTAATLRSGNKLKLNKSALIVRDIFQMPATGKYGLLAQSGDDWAVVRWTADNIESYLGRALNEKDVLAAFQ